MELFEYQPIALNNADLEFRAHWLEQSTADDWLAQLLLQTPWQQPELKIFGREVKTPRLVAWYGDPGANYRYSGLTHAPMPWTPLLGQIRQQIELAVGQRLNGVLLNYYRDGQDSMGWHSDDEVELGPDPLIASLSLGGTRRFDLRPKGGSRIACSLSLSHGSLLVMRGPTQHYWQHQVAKTAQACAPRLNLTFRYIRPTT